MNTETPTETPAVETTIIPDPVQEKRERIIKEQGEYFTTTESALAGNREFFAKHVETLCRFSYSGLRGWDMNMEFSNYNREAKEIARCFGADGWKRKKNPYSCGMIDWVKEVDGHTVTIRNAEKSPELREEVRIA